MYRHILINLTKCNPVCIYHRYDDGGGHCEPFTMCDNSHREIKWWESSEWEDEFPIWCKLNKGFK